MAHNIEIVRVFHKDVLGQGDVNEHFAEIVGRIHRGQADGVIVFSMRCICPFMENAYTKVGMVKSAGYIQNIQIHDPMPHHCSTPQSMYLSFASDPFPPAS